MKTVRSFQWDVMGILVSVLCTLHCVVLPVALSSLSVAGLAVLENVWVEAGLVVLAFVFGGAAFYKGCFVLHKRKWPLLLFCIGFCLLLANQWHESFTLILIPLASTAIITGHVVNYRYCQKIKRRALLLSVE